METHTHHITKQQIVDRFKKLADPFAGGPPNMAGQHVHSLPERILGTARRRGEHPFELMRWTFAEFERENEHNPAAHAAPYAFYAQAFGKLVNKQKFDKPARSRLEELSDQMDAARKGGDKETLRRLGKQYLEIQKEEQQRGTR